MKKTVPGDNILKNLRVWCQKTYFFSLSHFGTLVAQIIPTLQAPIAFPGSVFLA